jgi:starvation-inducible outer membrane lipoprotein
LALIFEFVCVG